MSDAPVSSARLRLGPPREGPWQLGYQQSPRTSRALTCKCPQTPEKASEKALGEVRWALASYFLPSGSPVKTDLGSEPCITESWSWQAPQWVMEFKPLHFPTETAVGSGVACPGHRTSRSPSPEQPLRFLLRSCFLECTVKHHPSF